MVTLDAFVKETNEHTTSHINSLNAFSIIALQFYDEDQLFIFVFRKFVT